MLRPFALHRPRSLHEATELLAEHRGEAALYAGGTELLLLLKEGVLRVGNLIDLKRVPGLGDITAENGRVAVEMFKTRHYDLVLVDLNMPVLDGYSAVASMRAWECEQGASPTWIVALTGRSRQTSLASMWRVTVCPWCRTK